MGLMQILINKVNQNYLVFKIFQFLSLLSNSPELLNQQLPASICLWRYLFSTISELSKFSSDLITTNTFLSTFYLDSCQKYFCSSSKIVLVYILLFLLDTVYDSHEDPKSALLVELSESFHLGGFSRNFQHCWNTWTLLTKPLLFCCCPNSSVFSSNFWDKKFDPITSDCDGSKDRLWWSHWLLKMINFF